jgi:hypothetical protein
LIVELELEVVGVWIKKKERGREKGGGALTDFQRRFPTGSSNAEEESRQA